MKSLKLNCAAISPAAISPSEVLQDLATRGCARAAKMSVAVSSCNIALRLNLM